MVNASQPKLFLAQIARELLVPTGSRPWMIPAGFDEEGQPVGTFAHYGHELQPPHHS
jgi:hypothetical protein